MARKIKWSKRAQKDRKLILEFWINKIKSRTYSIKLNQLFISSVEFVSKYPHTGRKTTRENIRIKFVSHFAIIYKSTEKELLIMGVFDTRQNPNKLVKILKEGSS